MITRDVGSAEGVVWGLFSIGCCGGGGGRGSEDVPRLHRHVDSDYQVLVVEAAEDVGEQQGVFGGETDDIRFFGVVVCAAACLG